MSLIHVRNSRPSQAQLSILLFIEHLTWVNTPCHSRARFSNRNHIELRGKKMGKVMDSGLRSFSSHDGYPARFA